MIVDPQLISIVGNHCSHTGPDTGHPDYPCADCREIIEDLHRAGFRRYATDRVVVVSRSSLNSAAILTSNAGKMLAHLVMDTPEDQAITDRMVGELERAAVAIRAIANKPT